MSDAASSLGSVLLLGARGMLGCALAERLAARRAHGAVGDLACWDIQELDICDAAAVGRTIDQLQPDLVINCAAYTDVDGCEANAETAMAVNGAAPGHVAQACARGGALCVHLSTDFVFDGASRRPYRPDDAPHPLSVYGRSKLAGERAVAEATGKYLIVRTSWLFGPRGRNFVEAILQRAEQGEALRVVDDQVGRPTFAGDLADAILRLVDHGARGVYHFANAGACSWHEFAGRIVALAGYRVPVAAISSRELGRPARRPAYSVLDTGDYERLTGAAPARWEDALERYLQLRAAVAN